MSPAAVREYALALAERYAGATKAAKGQLLSEFCATTGMHRKAAIRLLRRVATPPEPSGHPRGRLRQYGDELVPALQTLCAVTGVQSGTLLVGGIADLLPKLERAEAIRISPAQRQALLTMSAATIDRLLRPTRTPGLRQPKRAGPATTATLRQQVPIRTWQDWADVQPGEVQADLVLHCGETTAGRYLATLSVIDVATGWVELHPIARLTQDRVAAALTEIAKRLPMALVSLHTDNGSEFLNGLVLAWCQRKQVRGSRGRPYRKNDQAWVEGSNWSAVREVVGYDRYESQAALARLGRLEILIADQHNFVRPRRKLSEKVRSGAKLTKRYDTPATPYQRLLATGALTPVQTDALIERFSRINPLSLATTIVASQRALWALAVTPSDPWEVRVG